MTDAFFEEAMEELEKEIKRDATYEEIMDYMHLKDLNMEDGYLLFLNGKVDRGKRKKRRSG